MPRYFFHVHDGESFRDDIGKSLPDVVAVRTEAVRLAGELIGRRDAEAWRVRDWSLTVCDENGTEVMRLEIKRIADEL